MAFHGSFIWDYEMRKANMEKHGYQLDPNEKLMSYEELLNSCPAVQDWGYRYTKDNKQVQNALLDVLLDRQAIGVPFKNIDTARPDLYLDPRLVRYVTRSNGMAAGNTLTEALNQGLSELCERTAQAYVLRNLTDSYYAIETDQLENDYLKDTIAKIKSLGYDFRLYDLSYTCDLPVIMSLLIDKETGTLNINFGSFPVFDIAAERVLTELYQGVFSYKEVPKWLEIRTPYRAVDGKYINRVYGNSITGEIFTAEFIDKTQLVDKPNPEVFIPRNSSNEEILQSFIDLQNKQGCQFYYIDNSLSDKIHAVHIINVNSNTENEY